MRRYLVEILASATTIAAMALGTTTVPGALCLVGGNGFWWAFTLHRRAWGLVPVNVATLVVGCINLWRLS